MKRFNRSVGGRAITKQEFFPVFNIAWNKAMTPANIMAGFKRSGIWPPDMEVLPHELFSVSGQQCESSGSVQFGVENCGQVQFVAQFPEAFCYCKYMYMYICTDLTHIDSLSVFYSS